MKITLLTFTADISAVGLRTMCSVMKDHGHQCSICFFPLVEGRHERPGDFSKTYSPSELDLLARHVHDSDVIGVSLMSNYICHAIQVTRHLEKKVRGKIIWGGVHCSAMPDQCLEYVDYICVGEGEEAFLKFVERLEKNGNLSDIPNIWVKSGKGVVKNMPDGYPDLKKLPVPDLTFNHHILTRGKIVRLSAESAGRHMSTEYRILATRGCPFNCTYCFNDRYKKTLYPNQRPFRKRTIKSVMKELGRAKEVYPFVNSVCVDDDGFFALPIDYIRHFAYEYKRRINLPLTISGINPNLFREEKLEVLCAAGLKSVRMGIQSGSPGVRRKIYKRRETNEQIIECARKINQYPVVPTYDVIVDNPWETEEDKAATIRLLSKIPMPYQIARFSLTFYPGTELFDRAVKEGKISADWISESSVHYEQISKSRMNRLLDLCHEFMLKTWMCEFLLNPLAVTSGISSVFRGLLNLVKPAWHLIRVRKHTRRLMYKLKKKLARPELEEVLAGLEDEYGEYSRLLKTKRPETFDVSAQKSKIQSGSE